MGNQLFEHPLMDIIDDPIPWGWIGPGIAEGREHNDRVRGRTDEATADRTKKTKPDRRPGDDQRGGSEKMLF
jgi:hypothetical protein